VKTLFLFFVFCAQAHSTIYLTVSGANVRRAKLALGVVHPLPESGNTDPQLARNIREQLRADLEFSNLFEFISESSFSKYDVATDYNKIKFEDYAPFGAAFTLKLAYRLVSGKLSVEAYLFDIPGQKKIFGTKYQYPAVQYYKLVHAISQDILKELTGEKGLFSRRILMTCWAYPFKKSPPKEVYAVDPDGRNLTQLTTDKTLSTSPSWMSDGKNISYTQFDWV